MELTWESDFTLGTRVRLHGIHMLVYVSSLVAIDIYLVALLKRAPGFFHRCTQTKWSDAHSLEK